MRLFGLIGNPLSHSYSQRYFLSKFESERILDARYELFPLERLDLLPGFLSSHPDLKGFNVTIPYKESIIPYLSEVDPMVTSIGAANVVKRLDDGRWKGYNTDYYGFMDSLYTLGDSEFWRGKTALIFGTGGGAKAVKAAFQSLHISYIMVSRSDRFHFLTYETLTPAQVEGADILVNTTPVGMWPNVLDALPIPYEGINEKHIAIDLIYNPSQTPFLKKSSLQGARTVNGLTMLKTQAEQAWKIWNE
ncbi:MAG TPA: shikimate dehydrogenase [Catalimonadaceae bacterium]|nr:shikimate dehydrogenase [Catalimonadaceae bacterium]